MSDDLAADLKKIEESRKAFVDARRASDNGKTALIRAVETIKHLNSEINAVSRQVKTEESSPARVKLNALKRQRDQVEHKVKTLKKQNYQLERAKASALDRFSLFTDPLQGVSRLIDNTPIALFPLRLETRYRTVTRAGESPQRQFCVRVFPDDVLVDTFQPEIAETELENVTKYWVHRWRAGGDPAGHRAAWASLVRSSGAGRAKWLTEQVVPLNADDEPVANPGDHILLILSPTPVSEVEKACIATFWKRIWSTAGSEYDPAFADLQDKVGENRAKQIQEELVPVNFRDVSIKPDTSINPVVVFLDLPARDSLPISQNAWTRGARSWMLPERLVLLGFLNDQLVLQRIGEHIPPDLQLGPDPSAGEDQQIRAHGPDLEVPEPLRWMIDFEEAIVKGMGFMVNIEEGQPLPQFDRLFVLGVRLSSDAEEGAAELSELIRNHQASRKGLSILPQGRATNNADGSSAGYSWWDDPDESFREFFETDQNDDPDEWELRKDGAWLAGVLGIDRNVLRKSPHYHGRDQAEARAMNIALWPATLGYYMEQMMGPVFSEETVLNTRTFFNRFVIGRGTVPLIRIGNEPYGILPATTWSSMGWWKDSPYQAARANGLPDPEYLETVFGLTQRATGLWKELTDKVGNVGNPSEDHLQTLLDIVSLHPSSVEFYQRYALSFTQYYNMLQFSYADIGVSVSATMSPYVLAGLLALNELGWKKPPDGELPEILEKIFLENAILLDGPLVQADVSDIAPLSVAHTDGLNYIAWIQWAARTSHDTLRKQEGFVDGIPQPLLYHMLHHALDLGFIDAALEFRRLALQMSDAEYRAERKEPKYIHVAEQKGKSRWESLYCVEPAVTGDPVLRVGDYIPTVLNTRNPYLATQLSALEVLKTATTGSLERAFVEHLDCLTYRLDAWLMGLLAVQLSQMREESTEGFAKGGIYIGAYGWLENVHPKEEELEPVELDDELEEIFKTEDTPSLVSDSKNFGYIHGPSLDHAVTAAILRNGHMVNATSELPHLFAVDLESERLRLAQQIIEGISNGQSLGALLGYRLERALHEEPNLFLDRLIYNLRRAFPLAGNRILLTKIQSLKKITKVEARNVVDGAAFVDHIAEKKVTEYPYGIPDLPPLSDFVGIGTPTAQQIGKIIDGHVAQMRSVADAVADLQIAEGVYQFVRGNYDRASCALDAFSKGSHPMLPEVMSIPRKGRTLTHRVALHLEGGLLAGDPANTVPRAKGEPALAQWLTGQLPDPASIFARVSWRDEHGEVAGTLTPSMDQLGLASVDLFYMIDSGGANDMPGFDDILIDFAEQNGAPVPRHDAVFILEYKPAGVGGLTLFEVAPLVRALRGLVFGTRPLRPSDLALQNNASSTEDLSPIVRPDKVDAIRIGLQDTLAPIETFISSLEASIGSGVNQDLARDVARDNVDQWMNEYVTILRPVVPYGLQAASLTTAVEGRRGPFIAMLKAIDEILERWKTKRDDYDHIMQTYADLPGTATDEERTTLLVHAGRIVSTTVIAPLPPTLAGLENQIALLRVMFDTEFGNLNALRNNAMKAGATLVALTTFLPTYGAIDQTPLDITPFRDSLLALSKDIQQKATFVRDDITRRVKEATDGLNRALLMSGDKAQAAIADAAKVILGNTFILLPEFTLSAERLMEWGNAWTNRATLMSHLTQPFPLDDWRISVARVRERMCHLETAILLGDALGATNSPTLEALQFPFRPNDVWLGLKFPSTFLDGSPFEVYEDKLLYSAHFGPNAVIDPADLNRTYSGLILDEWVEVVPVDEVTSGLAFHFDRPSTEAPQAILLVTPPRYRDAWQWEDLVATLHETLDLSKLRAVEPEQLDRTALGPLLPAIISAVTLYPITAALNFSCVNNLQLNLEGGSS